MVARSLDPERVEFDWALIRSFLAALDAGTLLGAARRLGLSQPTVGRHIEALESQLGIELFERTGRGLTATAGAQLIAERARQMQLGADALSRAVIGHGATTRGSVRIAASRMSAAYQLPKIVAVIQAQLPDLDITVVSSDDVSNLLTRDADIAVRMVEPQQSSLVVRKLGQIQIIPCASRHYLNRWGRPKTLADLFSHRIVGPENDPEFERGMQQAASTLGLDSGAVRVVYRSNDFAAQYAAIQAGIGIGFAVKLRVDIDDSVEAIPIELATPALPVWLAVHREIRGNPLIRQVFDMLGSNLKKTLS